MISPGTSKGTGGRVSVYSCTDLKLWTSVRDYAAAFPVDMRAAAHTQHPELPVTTKFTKRKRKRLGAHRSRGNRLRWTKASLVMATHCVRLSSSRCIAALLAPSCSTNASLALNTHQNERQPKHLPTGGEGNVPGRRNVEPAQGLPSACGLDQRFKREIGGITAYSSSKAIMNWWTIVWGT